MPTDHAGRLSHSARLVARVSCFRSGFRSCVQEAKRPLAGGVAIVILLALDVANASAATRYVDVTGFDSQSCGLDIATACRSISQAISNASAGDTGIVRPGRYGDLNRNGVLGEPGEESGSPGCGCVLSLNKNVIVISSAGAAATLIDARTVDVPTNVLLITNGGEFGRPGNGFYVTTTAMVRSIFGVSYLDGTGIAMDSANVLVRGNQVIFSPWSQSSGVGIAVVNDAAAVIEGNLISRWSTGIQARSGTTISRNQIIGNHTGVEAIGSRVTGNVIAENLVNGIYATGHAQITLNTLALHQHPSGGAGLEVENFTGIIAKNNFMGNVCGLWNNGVFGLQAPNNHWGPNGPSAGVDDRCFTQTTVTPFATKPFAVKVLKP